MVATNRLCIALFFLVALASFGTLAFAQTHAPAVVKELPKLVLMELKASGAPPAQVQAIGESLCTEAGSFKQFEVLCPTELQAILMHQSNQRLMGCESEECIKQLAGMIKADWLLLGSVGKVGESYTINLRMMDAKAAKIRARLSRTVNKDLSKLLEQLKPAIEELIESSRSRGKP